MFLTPEFEQPNDVIVKVTTTNICGFDLHMYDGRTDFSQASDVVDLVRQIK
jgi:threonine dehydrogenase-like Zn-dependent dehydrogenase